MSRPGGTFAGLPAAAGPAQAGMLIAIIGAEHATPYEAGRPSHSAGAPGALRAALTGYARQGDRYDFDLGGLPTPGAFDAGDVAGDPADPEGNRRRITAAVRGLLEHDVVPVVLGGDDSVPIPMFSAFEGRGPLTVVQIDAHMDWRDEVRGERLGWSSPMRRASEMPWIRRMVQVGQRGTGSAGAREVADARAWGSRIVTAQEVHRHGIAPVLDLVGAGETCLVTLDCDGLDPSIMPGAGPVAGRARLLARRGAAPRPGGEDAPGRLRPRRIHAGPRPGRRRCAHRRPDRLQRDRGDRALAKPQAVIASWWPKM